MITILWRAQITLLAYIVNTCKPKQLVYHEVEIDFRELDLNYFKVILL